MNAGGDGWGLDASEEWGIFQHPECLTLELSDRGALQFSSATKRSGRVDDDELRQTAARLNDGWGDARTAVRGDFSGLVFAYIDKEDVTWRRWFLGHGAILLFVTYNAETPISTEDERLIQKTLDTLRGSTHIGLETAC